MSIAIEFENSDVIWIDAVLSYSKSLSGRVTEHPVEDGTVISDSVIKDSPSISLSGIISNADLMFGRPLDIENYDGVLNQTAFYPVKVSGNKPGKLSKLLPESASFFISEDTPSVEFDGNLAQFDFASKAKERIETAHFKGEPVSLIEFDSGVLKKQVSDLYFQSINFNEGPDTGDALEFSFNITKVIKVKLESVQTGAVSAKAYGDNGGAKGGGSSSSEKGSASDANSDLLENRGEDDSLLYQGVAPAMGWK